MHGQALIIGSFKKLKVGYRRPVRDCKAYLYMHLGVQCVNQF